jgi:hypothetical protein
MKCRIKDILAQTSWAISSSCEKRRLINEPSFPYEHRNMATVFAACMKLLDWLKVNVYKWKFPLENKKNSSQSVWSCKLKMSTKLRRSQLRTLIEINNRSQGKLTSTETTEGYFEQNCCSFLILNETVDSKEATDLSEMQDGRWSHWASPLVAWQFHPAAPVKHCPLSCALCNLLNKTEA